MAGRTFAIGDIHGELDDLRALFARMPDVSRDDTVVFMGDYVDRGPYSRQVVEVVRGLDRDRGCKVVCLRGNHEDAWLKVLDEGWAGFVLPPGNGCYATMCSYTGDDPTAPRTAEQNRALLTGTFFPDEVIAWFRELPLWYEDEHAVYVHAGIAPDARGAYPHPRDAEKPATLLWTRTEKFFREYRGKRVVVGHTHTMDLPADLSTYTVDDPTDLWAGPAVVAIDTGCGRGGFLTAVELPSMTVYESRPRA